MTSPRGASALCWALVCGPWPGVFQCHAQRLPVFSRHRTPFCSGFVLQIRASVWIASPFLQSLCSALELGGSNASQRCLKTIPWVQANWQSGPVQPTSTLCVPTLWPTFYQAPGLLQRWVGNCPSPQVAPNWAISGDRGVNLTHPLGRKSSWGWGHWRWAVNDIDWISPSQIHFLLTTWKNKCFGDNPIYHFRVNMKLHIGIYCICLYTVYIVYICTHTDRL